MNKRALPKSTAGHKMRFGILPRGTKHLLDAALKVWELRNGFTPLPSVWERNTASSASGSPFAT
jgi:hypothetical protein